MLFALSQFEQSFNDRTLRKALRLFRDERLVLQAKLPGNVFLFRFDEALELQVRKRGNNILSYTCFCQEPGYCAHLGAALFYFQKDELGIGVSTRKAKSKLPSKRTEIGAGTFGPVNRTIYSWYLDRVTRIIEPSLLHDRLNQKQINSLHQRLVGLFGEAALSHNTSHRSVEASTDQPGENPLLYLHLALAMKLPLVYNLRLLGDETVLDKLLDSNLQKLGLFFESGLTKESRCFWYEVTLAAARINNPAGRQVFLFLLPRTLSYTKKETELLAIRKAMGKKNMGPFTAGQLNMTWVAGFQLDIRQGKKHPDTPEFIIAKADLQFGALNADKAFATLSSFLETVKHNFPRQLPAFLDYVTQQALIRGERAIELKYLKESILNNFFIHPHQLDRLFELLPAKGRSQQLNDLVKMILDQPGGESLEKASALLLRDGRADQVVAMLKKHRNKFRLLNTVVTEKLPAFDKAILSLYHDQLSDALGAAVNALHQKRLLHTAAEYFDRLPAEVRVRQYAQLLQRNGKQSLAGRFVTEKIGSELKIADDDIGMDE